MAGRFEIYRVAKGEYRFRFRAGDGEIVATGGSYPTRRDAKRAVAAVMHAADGSTAVVKKRRLIARLRRTWLSSTT
jgi:uncharacterized protein YegP (UPF0339 family)